MNDIPRATTPTLKNTSGTVITSQNIGSAIRIDVSGRASTAFSHELSYTFGNTTASIGTIASDASNQYYDWTPAANTFGPLLVNSDSATCSITCVTKNGANTIGTKTVNITLTAPSTWVPSNSTSCAPSNSALGANVYPAVASAVVVTVTCAGSNSSTISNVTVTFQDKTYTTTTITNGVATITTDACVGSGSYNLTSVVTDSRGRTATVNNITIIVNAYISPTIALSIFRTESDSSTTMAETGNYMRIEFAGTVANIGSNAVVAVTLKYKIDSTTTTLISGTTATYNGNVAVGNDTTCEVTATVKDTAGITTSVSKVLPIGYKTLDFLAGGHGITFGGASVNEGFVSNMDATFAGKVRFGKNLFKPTIFGTSNSIRYEDNGDGGVIVNGTNSTTATTRYKVVGTFTGKAGHKYVLTGFGGDAACYAYISSTDTSIGTSVSDKTGAGALFTFNGTSAWNIRIGVKYKETITNRIIYIMIRDAGITDNTWEPYVPDMTEITPIVFASQRVDFPTMSIRCGTKVITSSGIRFRLFTFAEIDEMMGFSGASATNVIVYATNGHWGANARHILAVDNWTGGTQDPNAGVYITAISPNGGTYEVGKSVELSTFQGADFRVNYVVIRFYN